MNAAAQGITNPDGSPITSDQIEKAMLAANVDVDTHAQQQLTHVLDGAVF